MPDVKSYTVGNGDMFYIKHGTPNFTIIDCQLFGDHKNWLVDELKLESKGKEIVRFISTHPDEDHIQGLEYLDEKMPISNFYVVENEATKTTPSESFKHYCSLRDDSSKAYYVYKGCKRKWMNIGDDLRNHSGIQILWPDTSNTHFKNALQAAKDGTAFNNISLVARYSVKDGASFMWIGDLETKFMEDIMSDISLEETDIVFAPHHGRKSGKLPNSWLDKLKPKIIVIGEAASRDLHYYSGYNKVTQTKALDITFKTEGGKVHCYSSNEKYEKKDWLDDEGKPNFESTNATNFYFGTLVV